MSRVAVTGAAGFIGTRVVEHLLAMTDASVAALAHSYSSLTRLSELPSGRVAPSAVEITDDAALVEALSGCDAVVHTVYGKHGTAREQAATTVDGTRALLAAADKAGVAKVVHVGTAAVHDPSGQAVLDESTPLLADADRFSYEQAKLAADRAVLEAPSVEAVVLRPTVVYGPWGGDWTTAVLDRLCADVERLPTGDDGGLVNAVYVDDVARAAVAATMAEGGGDVVLIANPEPVPWGRFYDAFRRVANRPDACLAGPPVADWEADLYAQTAVADVARAERLLGWTPMFTFEEGMGLVGEWAEWTGRWRPATARREG